MIYSIPALYGDFTPDQASSVVKSTSDSASNIVSLAKTVQYWKEIIQGSSNEYEAAIAEQKLAEANRELSLAKAAQAFKKYGLYAGVAAIGLGLLAFTAIRVK